MNFNNFISDCCGHRIKQVQHHPLCFICLIYSFSQVWLPLWIGYLGTFVTSSDLWTWCQDCHSPETNHSYHTGWLQPISPHPLLTTVRGFHLTGPSFVYGPNVNKKLHCEELSSTGSSLTLPLVVGHILEDTVMQKWRLGKRLGTC